MRRAADATESDMQEFNQAWCVVYCHSWFSLMKSFDIDYRDQERLAKEHWRAAKLEDLEGKREHTWTELDTPLWKFSTARFRMLKVGLLVGGQARSIQQEYEDRLHYMAPRGCELYEYLYDLHKMPWHHIQFEDAVRQSMQRLRCPKQHPGGKKADPLLH